MELTYCSFADDDCCRGVVVLDGHLDPLTAAIQARLLGINPGGELLAFPIPVELPEFGAYASNRNRLISPDEARLLFEAKSLREHEEESEEP